MSRCCVDTFMIALENGLDRKKIYILYHLHLYVTIYYICGTFILLLLSRCCNPVTANIAWYTTFTTIVRFGQINTGPIDLFLMVLSLNWALNWVMVHDSIGIYIGSVQWHHTYLILWYGSTVSCINFAGGVCYLVDQCNILYSIP